MRTYSSQFLGMALSLMALATGLDTPRAQELAVKAEPERYGGIIMATGGRAAGVVRVTIMVERLSTVEERKAYAEAIKATGSDGLAQAMEKTTLGYIQFDQNLAIPLTYAIKVPTDKGTMIRVATNRPISFTEQMKGFVSKDYPIGVAEFQIGKDGPGEGFILAASKVEINDKGQLQVTSLPENTGPQKITQIEREVMRRKEPS